MHRWPLTIVVVLLTAVALEADDKSKSSAAAKPEDSPTVKRTRQKLETPVTVDFKDERLKDVLDEFKRQTEISFHLDAGVSGNQSFTYAAKDKPLKDVLDEMFKGRGLGYVIGRKMKEGDRYEGWVIINQSDERGDPIVKGATPSKPEPKPAAGKTPAPPAKPKTGTESASDPERLAASKLKNAKILLEDGKVEDAREFLEQILTRWPETKAAAEAKALLGKLKN
jgi:hypothetical protein